jgi:4-hydroxy-tetrahydrodipicolinate reductase
MIKLSLLGSTGRMGQSILSLMTSDKEVVCTGAYCRSSSPLLNKTAYRDSTINTTFSDQLEEVLQDSDVCIDFSLQESLNDHLDCILKKNIPYVIGVTGMNSEQHALLHKASERIPVFYDQNMSVGMNKFKNLIEQTARNFSSETRVTIHDVHHESKLDAPSGTAIAISELLSHYQNNIEITSERVGDVIGTHTVTFHDEKEDLIFTHKAKSRDVFALGAIEAAKWITTKGSGFFKMKDLILDKA